MGLEQCDVTREGREDQRERDGWTPLSPKPAGKLFGILHFFQRRDFSLGFFPPFSLTKRNKTDYTWFKERGALVLYRVLDFFFFFFTVFSPRLLWRWVKCSTLLSLSVARYENAAKTSLSRCFSSPAPYNASFGRHLPIIWATSSAFRHTFLPDFCFFFLRLGPKRSVHAAPCVGAAGRGWAYIMRPPLCLICKSTVIFSSLTGEAGTFVPITKKKKLVGGSPLLNLYCRGAWSLLFRRVYRSVGGFWSPGHSTVPPSGQPPIREVTGRL